MEETEVNMSGAGWFTILGGALSVIGQFYGSNYYLPLIGGIIAVISGIVILNK